MDYLEIYSATEGTVQLGIFQNWFEGEELDLVVALAQADQHSGQMITNAKHEGGTEVVPEAWAAHQPIIGWVNTADGTLHRGDGRLIWPMPGSHMGSRGIGETLTSYSLLHIRARKERSSDSRFQLLAVGSLDDAPQAVLEQLESVTEEYVRPITVDTELGTFTFNRELDWFESEVEWNGRNVYVRVEIETDEPVTTNTPDLDKKLSSGLTFLRRAVNNSGAVDRKCGTFAAKKLLGLANEWRDDVAESMGENTPAPEITKESFASRIELRSITVPDRGPAEFEYDDGDMFDGHGVMVEVGRTLMAPRSADMG